MTVGGCAVLLYVTTLSHWYSADSLYFAWHVDTAPFEARFDAHHLLLNPACWMWVRMWNALGWTGLSIEPLQVLNAMAGAASVTCVVLIIARASGSLVAATLAGAGCAVAGGLWLYSTEAEDATLGLAPQLAVLALLLRLDPTTLRSRTAVGMGVAVAAVTLTYGVGVLLLAVAALVVLQGRDANPSWRRTMGELSAAFALTLLPVVIAFVWIQGIDDWGDFSERYLGGARYGVLQWDNVPRGLYAALRTLVLFPGLGINDRTGALLQSASTRDRALFAAVYAAVAVAGVLPVVLFWRHRREWPLEWRQRFALWVCLSTAFAFWWVPSELQFWLPAASGWWMLVGLLIGRGYVPRYVAVLAIPVLFVANGSAVIWPHRDETRNGPLQTALAIGRQVSPPDSLVTSSQLFILLTYFVGRTSFDIDQEGGIARAVERARAHAQETGGRVFLADVPLDPATRALLNATPAFEAGATEIVEVLP